MPPTSENIQANYLRLKNDRVEALRLEAVFKEELKKTRANKANFESEEANEILLELADVIKGHLETLSIWVKEFDDEIRRVGDAIEGLASNDIEEIRKAFGTFILSDTALSVKNVTMYFYDLNQILISVKRFHEEDPSS